MTEDLMCMHANRGARRHEATVVFTPGHDPRSVGAEAFDLTQSERLLALRRNKSPTPS